MVYCDYIIDSLLHHGLEVKAAQDIFELLDLKGYLLTRHSLLLLSKRGHSCSCRWSLFAAQGMQKSLVTD